MVEQAIQYLLRQYVSQSATPEERAQLMAALSAADYDEEELLQLLDEMAFATPADANYDAAYWKPVVQQILGEGGAVVTMRRRNKGWWKVAVAAAVVILVGAGIVLWTGQKGGDDREVVVAIAPDVQAPERARAMITLADGSVVYLDSAENGSLATQGGVELKKSADGTVEYREALAVSSEMIYNTLTNPRGSRIVDMTLSDGSRIWLNAGSSVRYPVAFAGNERRVEITGEAYFEVAKDPGKKFIVAANGTTTEVLGTHFNVNAYDDEEAIKVTLIEGSVRTGNSTGSVIMKPGDQIKLTPDHQPEKSTGIILDEVIAWKNGFFHFESADLKTILRQFARWYDIAIVYEGKVSDRKFFGIVKRSFTLKNVLEMLQDNKIEYRIEGRKLIVKSS